MTTLAAPAASASQARAFLAVLRRDVYVTGRELPVFLAQVILQPLFLLFVFGKVLGSLGYTNHGYSHLLFPGLLALTAVITGMQTLAFPLVVEFGWTKEIEDRLLAPVPTHLVAAEKILSGVIQGFIAAIVVLPIARLVMGPIAGLTFADAGPLLLVTLLGATAFSALGMWIGTAISPQQIGFMFSVIIAPMLFFGCTYYPWRGLDVVPVLKYAVLVDPMVYVAEGLRGTLTPTMPHMSLGIVVLALIAITALFWYLGIRSFYKRAIG